MKTSLAMIVVALALVGCAVQLKKRVVMSCIENICTYTEHSTIQGSSNERE